MKKEKIILFLGILFTLLAIFGAFGIFYLIYQNTKDTNNFTLDENSTTNKDTSSNELEEEIKDENTPYYNENEEKIVTLYLFRGDGCHICENAIAFLKTISDDYSYLEIKAYEIWNNEENFALLEEVSKRLETKVSRNVPLMIIGSDYIKRGFTDGVAEIIKEGIKQAYENEQYEDIIKEVLSSNDLNVSEEIIY